MSDHKFLQSILHPRQMVFDPVPVDDDELTQAIDEDVHVHDDDWQLNEQPDEAKLEAFLDDALQELGAEEPEPSEETQLN